MTREGFIEAYIKLKDNLQDLCDKYKDVTISLVIKDSDNRIGRRVENVTDLFAEIPEFLTEEQLKDMII